MLKLLFLNMKQLQASCFKFGKKGGVGPSKRLKKTLRFQSLKRYLLLGDFVKILIQLYYFKKIFGVFAFTFQINYFIFLFIL